MYTTNPKISIITITYNSEKTLENTIKSVISQGYDNLEYLIIDGGSKDHTLDIVERYKDKIAVVVSEPDKGISDAFNKGIRLASGEIIGIINSDDQLLPNALAVIARNYAPDVDVYRGELIVNNTKSGYKFRGKPSMDISVKRYMKLGVSHPSTFITKRAYGLYGGYDIAIRYIMDIDMLCRLYNNGCKFKYVPFALAMFNTGGATNDAFYKKITERYYVIRKNGGSLILAFYISTVMMLKDVCKLLLDNLFGENLKYKLKKRKNIATNA